MFVGLDQVAFRRLIEKFGVDRTEQVVLAAFRRYREGRSIQEIAYAAGVMRK